MLSTDICIIGAGPVGLFAVFEAGLLGMKCHLIDVLPQPGGQLTEIYPKKPIYDIPGYPTVLAGELIENQMQQIAPFKPTWSLGQKAVKMEKKGDNEFITYTSGGDEIHSKVLVIAGGLGVFEPRKPPIETLAQFEHKGVDYFVKDPETYRDKKIVLAGGGDSALDWTVFLADVAKEVTLVHRTKRFRGAPDSVEKVFALAEKGKINLHLDSNVTELRGQNHLDHIVITNKEGWPTHIESDYFIPLFGLKPELGPLAHWGLEIEDNAIKVNNTLDYQTNVHGVFAIGDINTYPGKLKLILCGFHEATLMCQSAYKRIHPDKKYVM
ncbi:MAG: NAD(P)/FAD-dependent oxidoreductase, partial [Bacteroidia bacterium]